MLRVAQQFATPLSAAGVLVPLVERRGGLSLLLTRRARQLKHHAGQVSFPGGRMEAADSTIVETALRETWEEVGVAPADVEVVGYLPTMPTVTGYAVTPIVGIFDPLTRLRLDQMEVERAFEVPLDFLMTPGNEQWSTRTVGDTRVPLAEFTYTGERIWGATAAMILTLRRKLLSK